MYKKPSKNVYFIYSINLNFTIKILLDVLLFNISLFIYLYTIFYILMYSYNFRNFGFFYDDCITFKNVNLHEGLTVVGIKFRWRKT